jgi:tight adherence protein B
MAWLTLNHLMTIDLLIALAVFFAVLGLATVVASLGGGRSLRLQARLTRHTPIMPSAQLQRTARVNVLARPTRRKLPFVGERSFIEAARRDLTHADLRMGVGRYFTLRLLVAAVAFATAQLIIGGLVLPAVLALVATQLPRFVVKKLGARHAAAFEGQLAEALDLIIGSLRAGQGLMQAIDTTADDQPEPMRSELQRIVDQVNMGMSVSDAMESLTSRFSSRDVGLLAAAISINRQSGGNLTEVLERLAKTVRQRRAIRAEARSLTAAPRATGYMLCLLPVAIAAYSTAISPVYREQLLETPLGRVILVGACGWSLIGLFVSQKLAKVEYS